MMNRKNRIGLNEKMNMVWHDFHLFNFNIQLCCLLHKQFFKPFVNAVNKDRTTIFRAPNQMIADIENAMSARCVSVCC